jgi:hypothetical protein
VGDAIGWLRETGEFFLSLSLLEDGIVWFVETEQLEELRTWLICDTGVRNVTLCGRRGFVENRVLRNFNVCEV